MAGVGEFYIGPLSLDDVPTLVAIDSTWNPSGWNEQAFAGELQNQYAWFRGLYAEDRLVGYLLAHIVMEAAHIVSLGIAPAWRGIGGGRLLLTHFLHRVTNQGVTNITLEVRASNRVAQALYNSEGFRGVGIRKRYYSSNGEDAVTMRYIHCGEDVRTDTFLRVYSNSRNF